MTSPFLLLLLAACGGGSLDSASPPADTGPGPNPYAMDAILTLPDLQALGTHNSTHIEPAEPVSDEHRYTQAPITEQLDLLGVRQLELDLHLHEELGFQVFHLPVVDAETTCLQLTDCLGEIEAWSAAHPWHLPIMVWMEPKDEDLDGAIPELMTIAGHYEELEETILGVIPRAEILTPDDLRGDHATLPEAILAEGWPTLGALRGKVLFSMLDSGSNRAAYLEPADNLAGRLLFVDSDSEADPFAAMFKIDDAVGQAATIQALEAQGFVVTSNVDSIDHSDEENQASLDGSLASGTNFLSSDLPGPVEGRSYQAIIPDGQPARCNPVRAPEGCTSADIEALR